MLALANVNHLASSSGYAAISFGSVGDAGYLLGGLALVAVAAAGYRRRSARPVAGQRGTRGIVSDAAPTRSATRGARRAGASKVPARITGVFWAIKLLSTAMGESLSDALVHGINQYLAVAIGFTLFAVTMVRQLRAPRYDPWTYWLAVAMVAVFGTMAADVLHIVLHVPYLASSLFYLVVLVAVVAAWARSEGTLSIHSITTPRRERFYWLTVLATFALGTATGDLSAVTLHLGYLGAGVLFAGLFVLPGLAYGLLRANAVATFWLAYVLTRPLGASFADWLGFGRGAGGLGLGHPLATVLFGVPIVVLVAYVTATRLDVPKRHARPGFAPPSHVEPLALRPLRPLRAPTEPEVS